MSDNWKKCGIGDSAIPGQLLDLYDSEINNVSNTESKKVSTRNKIIRTLIIIVFCVIAFSKGVQFIVASGAEAKYSNFIADEYIPGYYFKYRRWPPTLDKVEETINRHIVRERYRTEYDETMLLIHERAKPELQIEVNEPDKFRAKLIFHEWFNWSTIIEKDRQVVLDQENDNRKYSFEYE